MSENEEKIKEMDKAAAHAQAELKQHYDEWSARDVTNWWINWYLKTGHKRLGRIIVGMAKQGEMQSQEIREFRVRTIKGCITYV